MDTTQLLIEWRDAVLANDMPKALEHYKALRMAIEVDKKEVPWGAPVAHSDVPLPTSNAFYGWGLLQQKLQEQRSKPRVQAEADYAAAYERLVTHVTDLGKTAKVREVISLVAQAKDALGEVLLNATHLEE